MLSPSIRFRPSSFRRKFNRVAGMGLSDRLMSKYVSYYIGRSHTSKNMRFTARMLNVFTGGSVWLPLFLFSNCSLIS